LQALASAREPSSRYLKYDAHQGEPAGRAPMFMMTQISRSGVIGDATRAKIETGERLLEGVVSRLAEMCGELVVKKG